MKTVIYQLIKTDSYRAVCHEPMAGADACWATTGVHLCRCCAAVKYQNVNDITSLQL